MRTALLLLIFVLLAGAADTPEHFGAICIARAVRNPTDVVPVVWVTPCHLDDMPLRGILHNRFHVVFSGAIPKDFYMPPMADYVKVEATAGVVIIKSLFWGDLVIVPNDPTIRAKFNIPSVFEIRPQRLVLQPYGMGQLELLITEPAEDFAGTTARPSSKWQEDFYQTFKLLGRAK